MKYRIPWFFLGVSLGFLVFFLISLMLYFPDEIVLPSWFV